MLHLLPSPVRCLSMLSSNPFSVRYNGCQLCIRQTEVSEFHRSDSQNSQWKGIRAFYAGEKLKTGCTTLCGWANEFKNRWKWSQWFWQMSTSWAADDANSVSACQWGEVFSHRDSFLPSRFFFDAICGEHESDISYLSNNRIPSTLDARAMAGGMGSGAR